MKLKVFGVGTWISSGDCRMIVATSSQKKAAELFEIPVSQLATYGGQTWNQEEIDLATSKPGVVFHQKKQGAFQEGRP